MLVLATAFRNVTCRGATEKMSNYLTLRARQCVTRRIGLALQYYNDVQSVFIFAAMFAQVNAHPKATTATSTRSVLRHHGLLLTMTHIMGLALAELAKPRVRDPCQTRGPQPKPIAITSSVSISAPPPIRRDGKCERGGSGRGWEGWSWRPSL
jgi:hypothetical protein